MCVYVWTPHLGKAPNFQYARNNARNSCQGTHAIDVFDLCYVAHNTQCASPQSLGTMCMHASITCVCMHTWCTNCTSINSRLLPCIDKSKQRERKRERKSASARERAKETDRQTDRQRRGGKEGGEGGGGWRERERCVFNTFLSVGDARFYAAACLTLRVTLSQSHS